MTAAHHDLVDRSLGAERSGDAAGARALHVAVPAFPARGRHPLLLAQLAALGDDLPDWVWARWIAYQATRCEDLTTATGRMQRQVLKYAVETFHADQLADCHANGGDPLKVVSWVASESWLFHQLLLHEFEGLSRFVDELATGRLAERAALARSWTGARLSGHRIGEPAPGGRLRVGDVDGSELEVLDLGARELAGDSGWVLGRLVPSGVDDLLMFDSPPVSVSEGVARDVATSDTPWLQVKQALDEGRLVERDFMRPDLELVSDVLSIDLLRIGTPPADLERVTRQLRKGRDEIPRAAYRILRRASEGRIDESDAPHVAAAVLQPAAHADARRTLAGQEQRAAWERWAALVHPPARGRLLDLAGTSSVAA